MSQDSSLHPRGDLEEEDEDNHDASSDLRPLLPHSVIKMPKLIPHFTQGLLRAYYFGCICCIAGFLFGYDSGIIGGVLTLPSFEKSFKFSKKNATAVSALAVALQQLGAFAACLAVWPVTKRYGRKWTLVGSSVIFIIGTIIETIDSHSKAFFYVGRVVSGIGLGASSVIVPMYSSEMTPKEIRGQVGSFYQLFFTLGIFFSYWIDYGVAKGISGKEVRQWQIPIGLQILPAGLLCLGMLTVKESTRWLTVRGRHEEAWESLKWIRADDSVPIQSEMEGIRVGVQFEEEARAGFRIMELFEWDNFKPIITAALVFTAQQATGATAFAYYGPQYFKLLLGSPKSNETALLLTGIFGAIKVAACLLFVLFVVEFVDRRYILTGGAVLMAICQITTAAVLKANPAHKKEGITGSGIGTIALIYLFVIIYNFSWGPLPWPYVAEIFPARIREPGVGIGVAAQWLFNFVFSLSTPYMIEKLGWGTFLLWGIFDLLIAAYAWYGLDETRGKELEEITAGGFAPTRNSVLDLSGEPGLGRDADGRVIKAHMP